jgi:cystathionine beta-lyase/cystathionine gamma-synthase
MSNPKRLQDICPATVETKLNDSRASRPAIHSTVAYVADSPDHADRCLGGATPGFIYQRDANPTAEMLAEKCRRLHGADAAVVTSSGMSALSLVVLGLLKSGDEVLLSSRLYGKTVTLLKQAEKFGITSRLIDMSKLGEVRAAIGPATRLLIVETISNPMLRVADIAALAAIAHQNNALLLVDNTFASPVLCRPIEFGADLVWESMTKIMNGHGDVVMGLLCGSQKVWAQIPATLSTWGLTTSPHECWLVERGLSTLFVRLKSACESALQVAEFLAQHPRVSSVHYPGLAAHPDHRLASQILQLDGRAGFGHMVTFQVPGGVSAATKLIQNLESIHFCASLGELSTTLSHPASTSHRTQNAQQWAEAGIDGGTIRLSIGLESPEFIRESLNRGLASLDD